MLQRHFSGSIEVIVGSMFSGKTEELIRRVKRAQLAKQRVQVFKPQIDDRYHKTDVTSHSDQRIQAEIIAHPYEILKKLKDTTRVIGIDEAQFFDDTLVQIVQKLANRGIRVIVAGLDTDWRGRPFAPIPELMAVCEDVTKQRAICMTCGAPACRTQRITKSEEDILVGALEDYEARCRGCYEPHQGEESLTMFDNKSFHSVQKET